MNAAQHIARLTESSPEARFLGVIGLASQTVHHQLRDYWKKHYGQARVLRGYAAALDRNDPPIDNELSVRFNRTSTIRHTTTIRSYLERHQDEYAMITHWGGLRTGWVGKRRDLEQLLRLAAKFAIEADKEDPYEG